MDIKSLLISIVFLFIAIYILANPFYLYGWVAALFGVIGFLGVVFNLK
ncbi:MAG: hypothetical protein PHR26_03525 [Candidatus ainarchaeum sp.]|nr:hypothetical protein [Candidatus ainarchaeum sp.]MDD3975611.1 hypothetical protein [Candidatus ainarchaeum sp.]